MPVDIQHDFFVSYASADNREGWVDGFVAALVAEHKAFTGGRELTYFLDRNNIQNFSHWHTEIFNKGLTKSRFFLAFLSPNYFASGICRKEWRAWIEQEISLHILQAGSAPIYFVEVPGFLSKPMLSEHDVAHEVAKLCAFEATERFTAELSPLVKEARRRQVNNLVQPFRNAGVQALQQADLKAVLAKLAKHIDERADEAKRADASANTVPVYNPKFTGRLDELIELRTMLTNNRAGVIAGIHGLGGIGKTELAYTFAHAYASVYPGGRFEVRCEFQTSLRDAVNIALGGGAEFHPYINDEERKIPADHFAAVKRVLKHRLDSLGSVLLVLDNVSESSLLESNQTDLLTVLGPNLHLLATTRLVLSKRLKCLNLGEMKHEDALALLDKFRSFATEADRAAAESIVRQLGGFALALELVAAKLAVTESATYSGIAEGLGLEDLDTLAEDADVELRRHNHMKRLDAVLGPTLASLKSEERRTLEIAAFLPPENVPLPWLKPLVAADFPALEKVGKWGDPWLVLVEHLVRLGLLTPVQEETTSLRQVRVHRLVQELTQRQISEQAKAEIQTRIKKLLKARVAVLAKTTRWQETRWELEPLEALAKSWDGVDASWLSNQMGLHRLNLAEWGRAEPLMRRALAIDEASFGNDHPNVVTTLNNLASLLQDTNRQVEAEPLYRRALAIDEASFGNDHPKVATELNNLATLLYATNRLAEAEPLMRRALAIDEASFGNDHPNVASRFNNLAQLLQATNRLAEAEPLMRRALAIDEASSGNDHPDVAIDLNNLANLLLATNRLAEAEPLYRRSLAIDEVSFGNDHPRIASHLNNLAQLLYTTNRLAEAEPLMRRALAIDEASFGNDHPDVAIELSNLALLLQATNRLAEAEPLYRRALAIDEASFGNDHPKVATKLNNLASLLYATNRLAEAEPLMRRALAIDEASSGNDHPNVARDLNNLASLLYATNRLAEAEPLMRRALAIDEASLGNDHPVVARDLNNLAKLLQATNRLAEAEPLMWGAFVICLQSQGFEHPNTQTVRGNYLQLLQDMGLSEADAIAKIQEKLRDK